MPWPGPRNTFTGPAPTKMICSCDRQGRVSCPPLQMLFYPPLKTFSAVVHGIYVWSILAATMFASHKHPLANSHTSHGLFKEKSENDVQVKASGCIQVIKSKENITVFKQTIRLDASCYISHMYVHMRVKANYQAGCNIWLTLCIPYLYFVRKILLVNQNSHKIACNDSGQQNQKIKKLQKLRNDAAGKRTLKKKGF